MMTDKQIIYNCPHISLTDWGTYACKLYNPRDKNCIVSGGNCDSNISCPYKQLDQLKAENEDLKKSILQECPNCGEEYLNYKGVELYYENNDLKQTLSEIKEIAEKHAPRCAVSCPNDDYKCEICMLDDLKQILQKISECEVENG